MTEGRYQFAENDGFYMIKMSGNLKYTGSGGFDTFVENLFSRINDKDVFIDLTEARYLDSTNLGIMAKISEIMTNRYGKSTTIISTNPDITALLINIGFDDFFTILDECPDTPSTLSDISEMVTGNRSMAVMMLEAHKTLMELNDNNRKMFGSVVDLLQKEVDKE